MHRRQASKIVARVGALLPLCARVSLSGSQWKRISFTMPPDGLAVLGVLLVPGKPNVVFKTEEGPPVAADPQMTLIGCYRRSGPIFTMRAGVSF